MHGLKQVAVRCAFFSLLPVPVFAGVTVGVKSLDVVAKDSNGVTLAFPDLCKTPTAGPAAPVPIPYPNIAQSSDASDSKRAPKKVKLNNKEILTQKSEISTSAGDEAGVQKGLLSSMNMDKVGYKKWSFDVKAEGKQIVILQTTAHSGSNVNMPAGAQIAPSQTNVLVGTRSAPPVEEAGASETEVYIVDGDGTETKLSETALIALANGEYCAVCMANGKVTAIHRFLSITPRQRTAPVAQPVERPITRPVN